MLSPPQIHHNRSRKIPRMRSSAAGWKDASKMKQRTSLRTSGKVLSALSNATRPVWMGCSSKKESHWTSSSAEWRTRREWSTQLPTWGGSGRTQWSVSRCGWSAMFFSADTHFTIFSTQGSATSPATSNTARVFGRPSALPTPSTASNNIDSIVLLLLLTQIIQPTPEGDPFLLYLNE